MAKKPIYKVEFSIDGLSLAEQDRLFKKIIENLDYNARQAFHITVTDMVGGKHFIWDDCGEMPNGKKCKRCKSIDCSECVIWKAEE